MKEKFFKLLENHFYGSKVISEDASNNGKVKMLIFKTQYFETIAQNIKEQIRPFETSNIYDKLYTFFSKYLNETGTPFYSSSKRTKEFIPVYNTSDDVELFYKTRDLYYIKSERLFNEKGQTIHFEFEGKPVKVFFDESEVATKSTNIKDEIVFTKVNDFTLKVYYKEQTKHNLFREETLKTKEGELLHEALKRYKRQSECDFFIHKNAYIFLKDQLQSYLVNYYYNHTEFDLRFVEEMQELKKIGDQIIYYIASFEDEIRKLWEKPKLPYTSQYVISLSKLPTDLQEEILDFLPAEQLEEWVSLGMLKPEETAEDLKDLSGIKHQFKHLPLDTKHFEEDEEMKYKILSSLENLEEQTDGLLIHSDNFQALNTIKNKYKGKIQTIYIDPPYNTNLSEIRYKNGFKHSTWACMMENRLSMTNDFLTESGTIGVAIDDMEFCQLKLLMEDMFGAENMLGNISVVHNPAGRDEFYIAPAHEYLLVFGKNYNNAQFGKFATLNKEGDKRELGLRRSGSDSLKADRPNMFFPIYFNPENKNLSLTFFEGAKEILPIDEKGIERRWRWGKKKVEEAILNGEIYVKEFRGGYTVKTIEDALLEKTCKSIWNEPKYSAGVHGTNLLKDMVGQNNFDYPKSIYAVMDYLRLTTNSDEKNFVLDYFGGSGTTANAVINLNREDDGNRKYILIEMGDHFDEILIPRIKKAIFSSKWKDAKPVTFDGISHIFKYYSLQSYDEVLELAHFEYEPEKKYDFKLRDKRLNVKEELGDEIRLKFLENESLKFKGALNLQKSDFLLENTLEIKENGDVFFDLEGYDATEAIANLKGYTIEKILSKTQVKFKELEEITDLSELSMKDFEYLLKYLF